MSHVEKRLAELGFELPQPPRPMAAYVPAVRVGNLVFISGQGTLLDGKLKYQCKVGGEYSLEEGYRAAQLVILNALAVLKQTLKKV